MGEAGNKFPRGWETGLLSSNNLTKEGPGVSQSRVRKPQSPAEILGGEAYWDCGFLICLNMCVCLKILESEPFKSSLNPVDQVCDAHNQLSMLRFALHFSTGKAGRTGVRKWLSMWNPCHEDLNMLSQEPQPSPKKKKKPGLGSMHL